MTVQSTTTGQPGLRGRTRAASDRTAIQPGEAPVHSVPATVHAGGGRRTSVEKRLAFAVICSAILTAVHWVLRSSSPLGPPPDCSLPASKPEAASLLQIHYCGFALLNGIVDPRAIAAFASDLASFIDEGDRFDCCLAATLYCTSL